MAEKSVVALPRGTIVLRNSVGRALRKQPAAVISSDVVDCCGEFRAGDTVNVTFRGADGGQFAIATAIVGCDAGTLRQHLSSASSPAQAQPKDAPVINAPNLKLLWPR